jgi:hypothetical protein
MSDDHEKSAAALMQSIYSDRERQRTTLQYRIERFIADWTPRDPYDRDRFAADLAGLVHDVNYDATLQWMEVITNISAKAIYPIYVTKDLKP